MSALDRSDDNIVTDIRARLDRPLVLVGMMGTGKTRLGRLLAGALDLPFFDSDEEIEKAAGMSVGDIFDRFGEAFFRDGERRVIKRLLESGSCVISTGGGAVMTPETADIINDRAVSIWLRAELALMVERTTRGERRPLLQNGDPAEILKNLMDVRYPVYSRADITVDSHGGPAEQVLAQALDKLDMFLRSRRRA